MLLEKKISYRDFFPVLIDGEEPEKTLFVAKELGPQAAHFIPNAQTERIFLHCNTSNPQTITVYYMTGLPEIEP